MRKAILGGATALALASPAVAADLQVTPYSEGPSYEREVYPYAYRPAPPVVVEETVVVRRPVVVGPPLVVVEEYPYPVYAAPPLYAVPYAAPPVYAYAGPGWRGGWGHRRYFGSRW